MSEERTPATNTPQASPGIAWGDPIDEARKQELWTRLRAWWDEAEHGEHKGPFEGAGLTGAEVYWLAVCAVCAEIKTQDMTPDQAEERLRGARDNRFLGNFLNLSRAFPNWRDVVD